MNKTITLTRYTYETWMQWNKGSNIDQWVEDNHPCNFLNYIQNNIDMLESATGINLSDYTIKVVTLDKSFTKWMNENHLKFSEMAVKKYANMLTANDIMNLHLKNGMIYTDTVLYLHVVVLSQKPFGYETHIKLNDNQIRKVTEYLKSIYKHSKIYVPGYILTTEESPYSESAILEEASNFFSGNSVHKNEEYYRQQYGGNDINACQFDIPFVTRFCINSPIFKVKDLFGDTITEISADASPGKIAFTRECLDLFSLDNVLSMDECIVNKIMAEIFKESFVAIHPMPLEAVDINDVEEHILEKLGFDVDEEDNNCESGLEDFFTDSSREEKTDNNKPNP